MNERTKDLIKSALVILGESLLILGIYLAGFGFVYLVATMSGVAP